MIGAALRATPAASPAAAAAAASRSHGNRGRPSPSAVASRTDAEAGLIASCGSARRDHAVEWAWRLDPRPAAGGATGAVATRGRMEAWALGAAEAAARAAVGRTAPGRFAEARLPAGAGSAARARASGALPEATDTRDVSLRRAGSAARGPTGTGLDDARSTAVTSVGTVAASGSVRAGGTGSATAGSDAAGSGAATAAGSGAFTGGRAGSSEVGSTYPFGSAATRMPRWTWGTCVTASSLSPTCPTTAPSATVPPGATTVESSCSNVIA